MPEEPGARTWSGGSRPGTEGRDEPNPLYDKFHLAPPRNFQYPAVLLLLAEEPRHGYRLVDALLRLGFGPVDRPSVYRTLADLEENGLLTSWSAEQTAGSPRHVYALTDAGQETLAQWMDVVEDERAALERVTTRYGKLRRRELR